MSSERTRTHQRPPVPYRRVSCAPAIPSVAGAHGTAASWPPRATPWTRRAPHEAEHTPGGDGAGRRERGGQAAALRTAWDGIGHGSLPTAASRRTADVVVDGGDERVTCWVRRGHPSTPDHGVGRGSPSSRERLTSRLAQLLYVPRNVGRVSGQLRRHCCASERHTQQSVCAHGVRAG